MHTDLVPALTLVRQDSLYKHWYRYLYIQDTKQQRTMMENVDYQLLITETE